MQNEAFQDQIKEKAFKIREEAWKYVFSQKDYQPEKALELITEAAKLDSEYEPQIQGIKNVIDRKKRKGKVSLPKAINGLFVPFMLSAGFELYEYKFSGTDNVYSSIEKVKNNKWKDGRYFERTTDNKKQQLWIGRVKFGNQLGINIFKGIEKDSPEHFDFDSIGILKKSNFFEYLNQEELENVLHRFIEIFDKHILPWMEE